jgi:microcystin degradation protein MlrC
MRVVTGCICHESSTFTPVATTEASFQRRGNLSPEEILRTFRGTNVPTGGFIEGAEHHGFELIPTVYLSAQPSAPVPRADLDRLLGRLLDGIAAAGAIDGVLLELHGSMLGEGLDDADGYILAAVREQVGPGTPVVAQLDIHSNMSQARVDAADVLIGRETFPEVDMAARGRECADVLVRILRDGLRPTMALCRIPMMWGVNQVTAHSPMREAIAELHRIESLPGVVCGSIATGFPLADVPEMGASVYIVTDNDLPLAQRLADELGAWIWERRAQWQAPIPTTREALALAEADGRFPVIFADRHDNTGGGAPGDSTGMLRTFLEAGLRDACVLYVVDPESIALCREAGVGASVPLQVGGKSSPLQGAPVPMTAEVIALSEGRFRYEGPMLAGLDGDMGPSAWIRQGGVNVVLVTTREQPFCTGFPRTMGLEPRAMRYVGVKSTAHFRAGFESWAGQIHTVGEASVHSPENVPFHRLGRRLYPFDPI